MPLPLPRITFHRHGADSAPNSAPNQLSTPAPRTADAPRSTVYLGTTYGLDRRSWRPAGVAALTLFALAIAGCGVQASLHEAPRISQPSKDGDPSTPLNITNNPQELALVVDKLPLVVDARAKLRDNPDGHTLTHEDQQAIQTANIIDRLAFTTDYEGHPNDKAHPIFENLNGEWFVAYNEGNSRVVLPLPVLQIDSNINSQLKQTDPQLWQSLQGVHGELVLTENGEMTPDGGRVLIESFVWVNGEGQTIAHYYPGVPYSVQDEKQYSETLHGNVNLTLLDHDFVYGANGTPGLTDQQRLDLTHVFEAMNGAPVRYNNQPDLSKPWQFNDQAGSVPQFLVIPEGIDISKLQLEQITDYSDSSNPNGVTTLRLVENGKEISRVPYNPVFGVPFGNSYVEGSTWVNPNAAPIAGVNGVVIDGQPANTAYPGWLVIPGLPGTNGRPFIIEVPNTFDLVAA